MKRKLFLLGLLLMFIQVKAQPQSLYTQTTFIENYTNLENGVPMIMSEDWITDYGSEIQSPFPFKIAGESISFFVWTGSSFTFFTQAESEDDENVYELLTAGLALKSRPVEIGVPQSLMSYKVEGAEGSRILRIEVRNAGLKAEPAVSSTTNIFMNFQIWIYEGTDVIEYRYGTSNITPEDLVTYDIFLILSDFLIGVKGYDIYNCFVYNDLTAPTFAELFGDEYWNPYRITTYPAEKTVYRFAPNNSTVSTENFNKTQFRMYPNPVTSILSISLEKMDVTDFIITDMTGKTIQKGTFKALENTIEVADLTSGMYFIRIGDTTQKFVKK